MRPPFAAPGNNPKDGRLLIKQLIVINFWVLLLHPGLFPWQHPLLLLLGCSSFTQQVKPRAARAGWWSAFIFSGPSTKVSWGHQKPKGNYFSSSGLKVHRLLLGQSYRWPSVFNVQSSFFFHQMHKYDTASMMLPPCLKFRVESQMSLVNLTDICIKCTCNQFGKIQCAWRFPISWKKNRKKSWQKVAAGCFAPLLVWCKSPRAS